MPFEGFPRNVRATHVPDPFFNSLLEEIDDLVELKVTLRVIWMLGQERGYTKFVAEPAIISDATLARSLAGAGGNSREQIRHGLALAVSRGTLLRYSPSDSPEERCYLLNTEMNRRRVEGRTLKLGPSSLPSGGAAVGPPPNRSRVEPTQVNIFDLYENNIGTFGPLIAQQLGEAEEDYPPTWIEDAFKLAINENKRSWAYISAILRRWAAEGRGQPPEAGDKLPGEPTGVGVKAGATLWEADGSNDGKLGKYSEKYDRSRQPRSRQRR